MMENPGEHIRSVSFIGSGNIATRLCQAFIQAGIKVDQVWSRNPTHAEKLAQTFSIQACKNLQELPPESLVFICVPDDVIPEIVSGLPASLQQLVHVSGSMPLSVLEGHAQQTGVFYPLQSFLKDREVDWQNIPIGIEGNTNSFANSLFSLAEKLTEKAVYIPSEQRFTLHTAAVIVNNFTNYLFSLGYDLLKSEGLSFDLLLPLISETARRLENADPSVLQTGPAKRNDQEVIRKHISALENHPEIKEVYEFLTEKIGKRH